MIVKLKTNVVLAISSYIFNWKRLADDTVGYMNNHKVAYIKYMLENWTVFTNALSLSNNFKKKLNYHF